MRDFKFVLATEKRRRVLSTDERISNDNHDHPLISKQKEFSWFSEFMISRVYFFWMSPIPANFHIPKTCEITSCTWIFKNSENLTSKKHHELLYISDWNEQQARHFWTRLNLLKIEFRKKKPWPHIYCILSVHPFSTSCSRLQFHWSSCLIKFPWFSIVDKPKKRLTAIFYDFPAFTFHFDFLLFTSFFTCFFFRFSCPSFISMSSQI